MVINIYLLQRQRSVVYWIARIAGENVMEMQYSGTSLFRIPLGPLSVLIKLRCPYFRDNDSFV